MTADKLRRQMPRYNEIDFYDKFPADKDKDTGKDKDIVKHATKHNTDFSMNRDFDNKVGMILEYGDIAHNISLKSINYSFSPKLIPIGSIYV